eukprot:3932696-Rhodomonas_salina.3
MAAAAERKKEMKAGETHGTTPLGCRNQIQETTFSVQLALGMWFFVFDFALSRHRSPSRIPSFRDTPKSKCEIRILSTVQLVSFRYLLCPVALTWVLPVSASVPREGVTQKSRPIKYPSQSNASMPAPVNLNTVKYHDQSTRLHTPGLHTPHGWYGGTATLLRVRYDLYAMPGMHTDKRVVVPGHVRRYRHRLKSKRNSRRRRAARSALQWSSDQ